MSEEKRPHRVVVRLSDNELEMLDGLKADGLDRENFLRVLLHDRACDEWSDGVEDVSALMLAPAN